MLAFALAAALAAAQQDPAPGTLPMAHVSVGSDHACALDEGGRAFCWGANGAAQLGARTATRCGIVGESGHRDCRPEPSDSTLPAGGGMRFAAISAGRERTCGVDAAGAAFCWGAYVPGAAEACGEATRCSFDPRPYEPSRRFRALSTGARVTCGVTVDGQALCTPPLSGNRWWELGALRPVKPSARAVDVAAFADGPKTDVCMVDDAGAAWCRGSNGTGQLGSGAVRGEEFESVDSLVHVAAAVPLRRVVLQDGWACGLARDGGAYCWGLRSTHEYAGAGETPPGGCWHFACAPAPVPVGGALRFRDLAAHHRRVCGLTAAGEAYCWAPAAGPASPTDPSADYAVARAAPDIRFLDFAGDADTGSRSCGVTVAGELFCWPGDDAYGEPRPPSR